MTAEKRKCENCEQLMPCAAHISFNDLKVLSYGLSGKHESARSVRVFPTAWFPAINLLRPGFLTQ